MVSVPVGRWRRARALCAAGCVVAVASCGSDHKPTPLVPAGVYNLRIETPCAGLPAEIRTRTYLARIDGSTVTLSGATFWQHPTLGLKNTFPISVAGEQIILVLNQAAGIHLRGVIEETAPGRYFQISGTGTGSLRADPSGRDRIEGTLSAGFGWGENLLDDSKHVGCVQGTAGTFAFTPTTAAFPPPGVAFSLLKLEISGSLSMAPGETRQLVAVGHFTDGSTSDVTSKAGWNIAPATQALRITQSGLATALAFGEAPVDSFIMVPNLGPAVSDRREVVVVPPNTFRVSGRILTGTPAQAVFDAEVTVVSGPAAGLSARSDWDGRYALYGVVGDSELRVTKPGYASQFRSMNAQSHQTLDVTLPTVAMPNVSGAYTLTIRSDQTCESPVDPAVSVRTYTAVITQTGRALTVTLGGASFLVLGGRGNNFPGTLDPEEATFQLDDNFHFEDGGNPDVVELLGGNRVMMLFGTITTDVTPNRLSGRLNGSFWPADRASGTGFFWGQTCTSTRHEVVFSR